MLGTLLGLGTAALQERRAELDRAFADEGAAALLTNAPGGQWRCDPIPFLFTESEFFGLAEGLAQRARLLEALLQDVYGPRQLLAEGLLPPALVYPSPRYLRACRDRAPERQLHLYAADLLRAQDGTWQVLADRTAEPAGLAYALENRRIMARVLPELFSSMQVAELRPFFEAWQDALQRLAPPGRLDGASPGLALLTPGHGDPRWFEHVLLARELGCALVEAGDLTVRDGALWVKTLRGLLPVHVLLRRQDGGSLDPLELHDGAATGIPGLFCAARDGAVTVLNAPGAGYAESPGLAPFMAVLSKRLLGEDLRLPSVPTHWLGDETSRALVETSLGDWVLRPALDGSAAAEKRSGDAALRDRIAEKPWAFAALRQPAPSFAPCAGTGDTLEPKGVIVRLFLLFDGYDWRPLPGGVAPVMAPDEILPGRLPLQALSKDVWVLLEEGGDIRGPGQLAMPALAVRRMAGDLPSRVADNFYWFGRYLERLENAARLSRAMLARLSRAGLLPRDMPEVEALAACLAEAGVIDGELAAAAGPGLLADTLLRAMARDDGALAHLIGRVQSLADTLRDRLSGEMHTMVAHGVRGLKGARLAVRGGRRPGAAASQRASLGLLSDFAGRILEFSATVSGYAAENMVRGGGRLFLDLGRRIERIHAISAQLAFALDQQPERIEAGLLLALELCDSMLTYRSRYLGVVQPALVLDLVLADEGNPRGLGYQLTTARAILAVLDGRDDTPLANMLDAPIAETNRIVADLLAAPDQALCAATLPDRLRAIDQRAAALSTALGRRYFTLLPATWTETLN